MQIVNHADFFQHRRKQEVDELPSIDQKRRDNRIAEEKAYQHKRRAVANAPQNGDSKISKSLPFTRTVRKVARSCRTKPDVQKQQWPRRAYPEQHQRCNQSRKIFPAHQHFAAQRREEIIMQASIDYFTAKQIHENPRATEEHNRPEDQALVQICKNNVDFADVVVAWLFPTDLRRQRGH